MKAEKYVIFYRDSQIWGELTWTKWNFSKQENNFLTNLAAKSYIQSHPEMFKNMTLTIFQIFE